MSLDNLDVVMASVADAFCGPGKATIAHHEQDKHGQKMEGFSDFPETFFFFMNLHQWLPLVRMQWTRRETEHLNLHNTLLYRHPPIMQLLLWAGMHVQFASEDMLFLLYPQHHKTHFE